ncbi:nose resistant to fluoxetine protein 6-like isoform X1 [Lytechinus variegatus]|uniref:nose resistant to fluoxetine protein 6-like isoform X1 n=1 Tax=Lytechinus variegatus TaxID=7654 RepID=UPI001BB1B02A|nr:nose resistant to fluoxetine protein 6-like isoform X1 [Lytechinus variegatus]
MNEFKFSMQIQRCTREMSIRLALQTLLVVSSLCIPTTSGLMTPGMIRRMVTAGLPPLQPQILGEVSTTCKADLAAVILTETDELQLVVDAIGKPQSGLMHGNLAWLGHFDECNSIPDFNYCLSTLQIQLPANATNIPNAYGASNLMWGLCVPESCSDSDIVFSLQDFIELVEAPFNISAVNASSVVCAQKPPIPYNNTGFIVVMSFLAVVVALMLLGAFLDKTLRSIDYKPPPANLPPTPQQSINRYIRVVDAYPYQRMRDVGNDTQQVEPEQQEGQRETEEVPTACTKFWHQFVLSFAVNRNLAKLLSARKTEGSISCLNGIRVISMTWVIMGHVMSFVQGTGIVANPLFAFGFLSHFGFQAISNAFFSVDSFFFLSGLLVAYMALGRMVKTNGKLPWLWFYFHRYWRLTPALGMTMLISLYIKPYLGSSPIWYVQTKDVACEKYWWANLLYVNNLVQNAGQCIGWVWYLANDMQFFVISPPLLIMLYKVPIAGILSIGVMCLASFISTGVLMAKYNFSAVLMDAANPHQDPNNSFMEVIYDKPYCRIAPYLVGMVMGYFLHLYKNKPFKLHPIVAVIGWLIAAAIGMTLVYGLYPSYHGHVMSTAESAAYMALCRFVWAVCLSWVVFACHYGYGGWINDFLSWELWIPMSRLTYSAYLLHPIIISIYNFNFSNNYFYSIYMLAFEITSIVTMAYLAAILLAVTIEFPLGNLEKFFMPLAEKKTK